MVKIMLLDSAQHWPGYEWQSLLDAYQTHFCEQVLASSFIAPLEGGHSHDKLFIVSHKKNEYVLRMVPCDRDGGEQVGLISQWASQHSLGTELYLLGQHSSFLLMEKLPGTTVLINQLKKPAGMRALAETLSHLHHLTPLPNMPLERLFSKGLRWEALQPEYPFLDSGVFAEAHQRYLALKTIYDAEPVKQVMLHSDINPGNIFLQGDKCLLIDWEFAGLGRASLELARTCEWLNYSQLEQDQFLTYYYQAPVSTTSQKAIEAMRIMTYFDMFCGYLHFVESELFTNTAMFDKNNDIAPFNLFQMADRIERGIERKTTPEACAVEAVGFFKQFLLLSDR